MPRTRHRGITRLQSREKVNNAGYQACDHLRVGQSVDDTTAAMMWYPGATNAGMRALVVAAQQTLCR